MQTPYLMQQNPKIVYHTMKHYTETLVQLVEVLTTAHQLGVCVKPDSFDQTAGFTLEPTAGGKPVANFYATRRGNSLHIDKLVVSKKLAENVKGLGTYIALSAIGTAKQCLDIGSFTLQSQSEGGSFWPKSGFRPELASLEGVVSNYLSSLERNKSQLTPDCIRSYESNLDTSMQLMARMSVGFFDLVYDAARQQEELGLALTSEFAKAFLRARMHMRLPASNMHACTSLAKQYCPTLRPLFKS